VLFAIKRAIKISIANKNKIKPQKKIISIRLITSAAASCGQGVDWAWVWVFCVYLIASFSKLENHADSGMC
jgi:hypothetical protein